MPEILHPGGAGLPDVNRGPDIIAATTVTTVIALITVLARLYVRVGIIRNVGLDDYIMLLTMLLSLSGWGIIIPEVMNGAGRHTVYVQNTAVLAMQLNFATQVIYLWAIGLVKVAIGLFLLRFAPRRGYKIFIWVILVIILLYTTIGFLTLIFQCKDIRSIWNHSVKSECFKPKQLMALTYANTGLNILTDLIFAFLPAIMLRRLQVNRRVKASLVCILSLGVFACAVAFVKLSILPNYGRTGDFLWDYTELTIWVVVECNTGIIAGSLPTLKPLFKKALQTYGSASNTHNYKSRGAQYRLRSLSRSVPGASAQRRSRQFRADDIYANHDGLHGSYSSAAATANPYVTIGGSLDGNDNSEENILAQKDGIMCTTEVSVLPSRKSIPASRNMI